MLIFFELFSKPFGVEMESWALPTTTTPDMG
jgi:hypothetical protein